VGIKTTLGKANNLSIVILLFDYLTTYKVILSPSKKHSETCILNGNGYKQQANRLLLKYIIQHSIADYNFSYLTLFLLSVARPSTTLLIEP
jgi:hypothetical protein